ncbi:hypothetical protein AX16_000764 [Volvariella volvacea WC 439]|nr:hypothetical protein AX16_000764 [Volvariella volvacea WC 439]
MADSNQENGPIISPTPSHALSAPSSSSHVADVGDTPEQQPSAVTLEPISPSPLQPPEAKTPLFGPLPRSTQGQLCEFSPEGESEDDGRNVRNGRNKRKSMGGSIFRLKPRFLSFGSALNSSSTSTAAPSPSAPQATSHSAPKPACQPRPLPSPPRPPSPSTNSDASTNTSVSTDTSTAAESSDSVTANEVEAKTQKESEKGEPTNPPLVLAEEYASAWAAASAFDPEDVPGKDDYSSPVPAHPPASGWKTTAMVALVSLALGFGIVLLPEPTFPEIDFMGLGLKLGLQLRGTNLAKAVALHYPPKSQSQVYSLDWAFEGSGAPGIFNSSGVRNEDYGMYNWCNMPHVRKREYVTPPKQYKLEYVEVIQRHHKRTPYGSNTFFEEDVSWDCTNDGPLYGSVTSKGIGRLQWQGSRDPANPWSNTVGPGFINSTCQFPQITPEGLEDSIAHGSDLRAVYFPILKIPPAFDPAVVSFRVTNNPITSQVLSALLIGLYPTRPRDPVQVLIQPSSIDSLEPTYSCPRVNTIRNSITTDNTWREHLQRATAADGIYDKLDKVSGIARGDTAGWHTSFDHYYDNLSAKQCHAKSLPCSLNDTSVCLTQEDANTVYRLGNWECGYLFRGAPLSASYGALRFGGWMLELKSHLVAKVNAGSRVKYAHNVAHDGSISSLLAFLQIEEMVWPGMGAEVVFELYSSNGASPSGPGQGPRPHHSAQENGSGNQMTKYFVRVLWSGQPLVSSTPLGKLDMVPLDDFLTYIDNMVGSAQELVHACNN